MKLHKLTAQGMSKLGKDLERLRGESSPHINIDDYESEEIPSVEVNQNKQFESKFSVGKYFLHIFPEDFQPCEKTWSWLSALYYRQLLSASGKKIGELDTMFISENYSRWPKRHFLKAPYDICKFYKNKDGGLNEIRFFLLDPVNRNGALYRRISENQDIRKNLEFMRVAKRLFYDESKKSIKRNATGAIQRLIKVWKQYERSFDMYRMPSQTVIDKLLKKHDELNKFIRGSES